MYPTAWHTSRNFVEPRIEIVPRVGGASPASVRSSVVFPAPLSPRMAYRRPAVKLALTPRSAAKRPNCLIRPLTTMMGSATASEDITQEATQAGASIPPAQASAAPRLKAGLDTNLFIQR